MSAKGTIGDTHFLLCPHITQEDRNTLPNFPHDTLMVHLTRKPESQTNTTLMLCPICASAVKGIILEHILQNAARDSLRGWR